MRFVVEHAFAAPRARLEALLDAPDLYARLEQALPAIERIEVLFSDERDGVVHRRVRYTPRAEGKLPSFARGRVTPEMLIWTEESRFVRAEHRIDYRVEPNLPERWRDHFASHGSFHLVESAAGVVRRVEGEVVVRVPLLGGIVERMLVGEVKAGFDADARVIAGWLAEAG